MLEGAHDQRSAATLQDRGLRRCVADPGCRGGANGLVAALLVVMMLWTSVIERGLDALAAAMALLILNKINKYNRDV